MDELRKYAGNIVDPLNRRIFPGEVWVKGSKIIDLREKPLPCEGHYILPGFVDSHIHIESSMLTPQHFASAAVKHGTVATVSDPHEIANVLGMDGIRFMLENAASAPVKFYFGAPSCVPATPFETSGAILGAEEIEELFAKDQLHFLSEVMNYPGILSNDDELLHKIRIAKKYNKKIDGHAPGLNGTDLVKYISAGIQTDHECSSYEEALEKLHAGMIIQIREGSAAKNFDSLYRIIDLFPEQVMLCSDDLHPNDLLKGHMNLLLQKGIRKGVNIFNLLNAINKNPITHYGLNVGMFRVGDLADFVLVKDLKNFQVDKTIINGKEIFSNGKANYHPGKQETPNKFFRNPAVKEYLDLPDRGKEVKIIEVFDGELFTGSLTAGLSSEKDKLVVDINRDILKIVVQNRYSKEKPAIGFIHGFGLKRGAIASSIAHDSHNIIVVGADDISIMECINWINENGGGIAQHDGGGISGLPLRIAGIISDEDALTTANKYVALDGAIKSAGCPLTSPLMTLSFMSLLVIPELKIGNMGLFDVNSFSFTSVYVEN